MRYFEDFEAGERFDCGSRTVTEAELLTFARAYDPQPFHLDHAAANASPLRGLALSGWHTCSVIMRLYYDAVLRQAAGIGAPGLDEIIWSAPARANVPIHVDFHVYGKRDSRSRPEMGFVHVEPIAMQEGKVICRFPFSVMMMRRGQEDAPKRVADRTRPDAAALFDDALDYRALGVTKVDELTFGQVIDLGEQSFTAESIVAFAADFDPQPFHLDEAAGRASVFGGLAASGWQTCSLWMRQFVGGMNRAINEAALERAALIRRFFGPSPGVKELKWRLPALVGDRFRFYIKPIAVEDAPRRADWAILIAETGAVNQFGAQAMSKISRIMVRRDAAA